MLMYLSLALGSIVVAIVVVVMISRMANRRAYAGSGRSGYGQKTLGDMAQYGSNQAFPEVGMDKYVERDLSRSDDRSGKPWGW